MSVWILFYSVDLKFSSECYQLLLIISIDKYLIKNSGLEISAEDENIEDTQENLTGFLDHHPHAQSNDNAEKSSRELLLEQQINELLEENASLKAEVMYLKM